MLTLLCYAQPKCPAVANMLSMVGAPVSLSTSSGTVSVRTLSPAKVREASQWAAYQNHQDRRRNQSHRR
jgi:hypothetical protein